MSYFQEFIKRYHRVILFVCLFFAVQGLFASPYDMILVGDPILEDLRYLSLESGKAFLSFTPPLAPHEIRQFLDSIDVPLLSAPALEAFYRIETRLTPAANINFSSEFFKAFLNINSTLEARARFNEDISWEPLYPKIRPFVSLPIRFFFYDFIQLYVEPSIIVTPNYYSDINKIGINVPNAFDYFDSTIPLRAFASAGGSWWNFQLGRDRLFFGTGNTASLSIADNAAFYEYARLSLFFDFFRYSLLINQMPLQITDKLYEKYDPATADYLTRTTQRYFYLHRIDVLFRDVLSIGIMEGLMVGNSALELRYLNPLMIFHSFISFRDYENRWAGVDAGHMTGSFFSLELNWNIIKPLAVYGQFVMNEFALPIELKTGTEPPNGLGYMAGLNYTHSFDNWASVFFLEFIYTYPYLYMNSSPFASFIQMRRVNYPASGQREHYYYIGHPRDTITLSFGANFFKNDQLNIGGELSWISRGEHNKDGLVWDWGISEEIFNERTPFGIPENKFIIGISAKWKPLSYLAFSGSITGIFVQNNRHEADSKATGGQAVFSVCYFY